MWNSPEGRAVAGQLLSVVEAAEFLGVHPQRVHQRIRAGSLAAQKVGNQWVLDLDDLRRIRRLSRSGRPLSRKSAWDLLAVAGSASAAAALSPSARSRARSRLRDLIGAALAAQPDDVPGQLGHALGNRAERVLFAASPRDLSDIRDDARVHASGVSLPGAGISAGDLVEGYVSGSVDPLVVDYVLSPAPRARANVVFHVVPDDADHPGLAALGDLASSPLAMAADLAEHEGVREREAALRSVVELGARLDGGTGGEDRG